MLAFAMALVMGATLAGSPRSNAIVCEEGLVRRQISRNVYTLDQRTRCYPAPTREDEIDRLRRQCDLLIRAYGEWGGKMRCRRLLREAGLDR